MSITNQSGRFKKLMGKVKGLWSKLTEKDLDRMAEKFEILVRELQDTYGYSRRQAVQVISQRVVDYRTELRKRRSTSRYE
jgi:uncharacterized protein YjbJ (UPF0337 family)